MEWCVEKCIELIKEFEKHECLWNVQAAEYKNIIKKEDAWHDISNIMNLSAEDVEKKMKSLLAAYRREKKKVVDSIKSGSGTDSKYTPKWFAYKHMWFLRDINRPKKTRESADYKSQCSQSDVTHEKEEEYEEICAEESDGDKNTDIEIENTEEVLPVRVATPLKLSLKKKNTKTTSMDNNRADIAFATMQSLMAEKDAKRTRDEYSAFGEVVGCKIRKLSTEYERDVTQFKINEILHQASMGNFRQKTHNSDVSRPSSQTSSYSVSASSVQDNSNDARNFYEQFNTYTNM